MIRCEIIERKGGGGGGGESRTALRRGLYQKKSRDR